MDAPYLKPSTGTPADGRDCISPGVARGTTGEEQGPCVANWGGLSAS